MSVRFGMRWLSLCSLMGSLVLIGNTDRDILATPQTGATNDKATDQTFEKKITPFLKAHCVSCHNSKKEAGGLSLEVYANEAHARKDRKTWESIQKALASGDMPPKKQPRPPKDDLAFVIDWIETTLTKVDCTGPKDPGRVTLRRLNRVEYNNTIRDLCGVTITPADDFPADDVGYGFDNIGDVLSLQPILLEKYMTAADKVLESALVPLDRIASSRQVFRTQNILVFPRSAKSGEPRPKITFTSEGSAFLEKFNFPADGSYTIRVRAWGESANGEPAKFTISIGGKELKTISVDAPSDKPATYEWTGSLVSDTKRIEIVFANPSSNKDKDKSRKLGVETIEIEGPIGGGNRKLPESTKKILVSIPKTKEENTESARKVVSDFARRAFRRPVRADEVSRLIKLYELAESQGEGFDKAIRLPLKAILVSPHFLFRIEDDPKEPDSVRNLNDYELATRLSYFLWSTMPDEELHAVASRGELHKPEVLKNQVIRMIADDKSKALIENFAGQWLQLRSLKTISPDRGTFKNWDDALRNAMIKESETYFHNIVKNDLSILELLDSDYTFVNSRLAQHYGIPNVYGSDFRKVKLPDRRRGGVLTQASVLTVTSNPTRTSPVKRGKWVLENLLGTPPPPPVPDVPELPPVGQLKGTLRQQMEQHRENPTCANCHAKLDPLGFGLENFDGIGGWRDKDNNQPVDSSGVLPDGNKFAGPEELRKVLMSKSDLFRRCLAEKLLTYSLGRGLEYYDKCILDEITGKLKAGQDRFSSLVLAIVASDAFQKRKGKRSE